MGDHLIDWMRANGHAKAAEHMTPIRPSGLVIPCGHDREEHERIHRSTWLDRSVPPHKIEAQRIAQHLRTGRR